MVDLKIGQRLDSVLKRLDSEAKTRPDGSVDHLATAAKNAKDAAFHLQNAVDPTTVMQSDLVEKPGSFVKMAVPFFWPEYAAREAVETAYSAGKTAADVFRCGGNVAAEIVDQVERKIG